MPHSDSGLALASPAGAPGLRPAPAAKAASFHRVVGWRVAWAAVLPLLLLVATLQTLHDRNLQRGAQDQLRQLAASTAAQIDLYLETHLGALAMTAQLAADIDPTERRAGERLQPLLSASHAQHPGFLSLLVAAADGRVVATALSPGLALPTAGEARSVADRDYFRRPMADGHDHVSEVFQGRGFGEDLIVALATPLRSTEGLRRGVVEGSLDLQRLRRFDPLPESGETALLVLDRRSRVIYASPQAALPVMADLSGARALSMVRAAAPGQVVHYRPARGELGPAGLLARWPLREGWEVVVRHDRSSLDQLQSQALLITGLLLLSALLLSTLIAHSVAAQVVAPIRQLAQQVAQFEAGQEPPPAPAGAAHEVQELFHGYAALVRRLRQTLGAQQAALAESRALRANLQYSLAERERTIEERTRELRERSRAVQIANAELGIANAELERLTGEDALTGVANRRAFDDFLAGSWRLAQRQQQPLALVLLDIDHFKLYNDQHGHPAGDQCLRRVAAALRARLRRPADLFARYGGEEFVAVLGQTDAAQAQRLAEGLLQAVRELAIPHGAAGAGARVSISLGVAALVPTPGQGAEQLLGLADAALYRAKQTGRDRVVLSD